MYAIRLIAILLLVGVTSCKTKSPSVPPPGSDKWTVESVRASTRAALVKLGVSGTDMDLSYITPELLEKGKMAKSKNVGKCREMMAANAAAEKHWCFYGHHVYFTGDHNEVAHWTNSNPSDYCDRPSDECYGDYQWYAEISEYLPKNNCPPSTQGHNSKSFQANP